jgi:hypothetical protein
MKVKIYEYRSPTMQRDMDLVRDLLLKIETDPKLDGTRWVHFTTSDLGMADRSEDEVGYHLTMLIEAGFIKGKSGMEAMPVICKLTWQGHEFLDDIRDPGIWDKTKERAKGLTSVGVALIWEIAKAELKQKLGLP